MSSGDRIGQEIESLNGQPRSLYQWLLLVNGDIFFACILLVAVNLACHWQTLSGYFLADDFVHVAYLHEVFKGHPERLLENFYTTWLQTEGTNFYRPFIEITLAFDRLISGFDPLGFHITNFFYQCFSTIALYLVVREIVIIGASASESEPGKKVGSATILPLMAGLLFAVHPLHSEVVSWIIARVDSVCCAFYLTATWLFLAGRRSTKSKHLVRWLAISSFILSLLSKEMAVTLPPTLTLLLMLFPGNDSKNSGLGRGKRWLAALKAAFRETWYLWLILIIYLIYRSIALGSVTGGYQGSIGEGLSASTWQRILAPSSLIRILLPMNTEVFTPLKRWIRPLAIVYGAMAVIFVLRLLVLKRQSTVLKIGMFAGLWFLVMMLPTIPVWNLTETLQGSRFIYMGTAPLCLFLAALLSPAPNATKQTKASSPWTIPLLELTSLASVALLSLYGAIVFGNNGAWVHASVELKRLRQEVENQVQKLNSTNSTLPSKRLAILNLPHTYKGAHMLYNAATLSVLLQPPLSSQDLYSRVETFEPVLFGDEDLIRISRVKEMINRGDCRFVHWDRKEERLKATYFVDEPKEVHLDTHCLSLLPTEIDARGNRIERPAKAGEEQSRSIAGGENVNDNLILVSPVMDVNPAQVDYLDLCLSAGGPGTTGGTMQNIPIAVVWQSAQTPTFDAAISLVTNVPADNQAHRMRLQVSERKKWLFGGKIHRLGILTPVGNAKLRVHGLSLLSGGQDIPLLSGAKGFKEDTSGVVRAGGRFGHYDFDASKITGAQAVTFEVSKPNAWFEHYSNTFRDFMPCPKALKTWTSKELKGQAEKLELKSLAGPGFYELRMAALGANGEITGYFSDPIMFQLGH